ncbi:MAG TPA: hypothetical protein VLH15_09210 [Dehalococcoidales bacterium]|nr:hypothetical protein [Dehalococcoidales bacterium]
MSTQIAPEIGRTAKPVVAGILSIIVGAGCILGSLGISAAAAVLGTLSGFICFFPGMLWPFLALPFLAAGVLAVIGGVFNLQRRHWGWALAGSITALLVSNILGLIAVVLTALSKDEFKD